MSPSVNVASLIGQLRDKLSRDRVLTDTTALTGLVDNSTAFVRPVIGVVYPESRSEVVAVVKLAREHGVALYPVSRGRNIGYGELVPAADDCLLVSLERMRRIYDYDPVVGEVTLEPGVSQADLFNFLSAQSERYFADMTGAPTDASVVGNILEGGFGHTPLGDRRKHIADLEVVLGTGDILESGDFPNLGPNLASLFVQSNFGIVTALRIPLQLVPEHCEVYTLAFASDASLLEALPILRRLKQQGNIQSSLHIASALRTYMSTHRFPADLDTTTVMTDADAIKRLQNPFVKVGQWTSIGGLYGDWSVVQHHKRVIREALPKGVVFQTFTSEKIKTLSWLLKLTRPLKRPVFADLEQSLSSLRNLFLLQQGQPTDEPLNNIFWRSQNRTDLGLLWHSPVIRAEASRLEELLRLSNEVFSEYRFERPLTLTLIDHEHLIGVFNINFDRSTDEVVSRAHAAFRAFHERLEAAGIGVYRSSVVPGGLPTLPKDRQLALIAIKQALDPMSIISPGRYGIGGSR